MKSYIKAISYFLPEKVVTTEDLVKEFPEWTAEKIAGKVGIQERHIASIMKQLRIWQLKQPKSFLLSMLLTVQQLTLFFFARKVPIITCQLLPV